MNEAGRKLWLEIRHGLVGQLDSASPRQAFRIRQVLEKHDAKAPPALLRQAKTEAKWRRIDLGAKVRARKPK